MEMDLRKLKAIIDLPVLTGLTDSVEMPGSGFLFGQYLIRYYETTGASAFYSFLNIHALSSHTNAARWTTIQIDTPISAFAFAPELNLAVAVSCVNLPVSAHHSHPGL
jgi:hypothetical protein